MAQETQVPFNNCCKSISTCASIKRIVSYLTQYQKIKDINDIHKSFNSNKTVHLSNDFNHVLMYHLGDHKSVLETATEYEAIYNYIKDQVTFCELTKCVKFLRNNRNREQQTISLKGKDKNTAQYYIDTMDCLHSYFLHSFDVGFRIKQSELNIIIKPDNKQNDDDESELLQDELMSKLSCLIQHKREKIKNICGLDRIKNTKYVTAVNSPFAESKIDIAENEHKMLIESKTETTIEMDEKGNNNNDNEQAIDAEQFYSFGHRYSYWNKHSNQYVTQKYANLYDEMLNNKICTVTKAVYNLIKRKAASKLSSQYAKQMKITPNPITLLWVTGKNKPNSISLQYIMAVLFYTDCSELSYHFSSTFRSMNKSDTYRMCKQRNSEYHNLSKLLIMAVNLFGIEMSDAKTDVFYHGINKLLIFNSFITIFNSPTSTTTQISVATVFAKSHGAVLDMTKYHKQLRFFNCCWLSCYANEDERLFVSPPHAVCQLRISSIRYMKTNENYKHYVHALTTLNYLITSQIPRGAYKVNKTDKIVLKKLFKDAKKCPTYVNKLFEQRIKVTKEIVINLGKIRELYPTMQNLFCTDWSLNVNQLCNIFTNCEQIHINYHMYNGTPTFFHCGTTYFNVLLSKLVVLNKQENETQLKIVKLSKIRYNWKTLKIFKLKLEKVNWNIMRLENKTTKSEIRKNVSGNTIIIDNNCLSDL